MLNLGVIGVGNCGNQVCAKAAEKLAVDVLAINSSEDDLAVLPESISKILIGDTKGVGKDRMEAKKFIQPKLMPIIKSEEFVRFMDKDRVVIVSSCGGGTGSGIVPMLADILRQVFRDVDIIVVGVLPADYEVLDTQSNALEFLHELLGIQGISYMLYDNNKNGNMPAHMVLPVVNDEIVTDIEILRGTYQVPTRLNSIDRKDSIRLTSVAGQIVIAKRTDIREKELDTKTFGAMLVESLKNSKYVDFERTKVYRGLGIITNLSEELNMKFDVTVPELVDYIGSPNTSDFQHIAINQDSQMLNNVFAIITGLPRPNGYILELQERVNQKAYERETTKVEDVEIDLSHIKRDKGQKAEESTEVDINDILSKYGLS